MHIFEYWQGDSGFGAKLRNSKIESGAQNRMGIYCIYFETVVDEMKQVLEQERPDGIAVTYWAELDETERQAALEKADAFLVATYPVTRELMLQAPNLKIVQKTGVGVDNIDVKAATELKIPVGNAPGGNAAGVAELTYGFIIGLYRKLLLLDRITKQGEWHMFTYRASTYEIKGKTIGIIGFGHIGREIARIGRAFGASILYYSSRKSPVEVETETGAEYRELDALLKQADIVTIHLPLNNQTRDFLNADRLALMKPSALLVNVSRGGVVNEADLYQALAAKRLAGAGIDVWANEPPVADNPLLALDNVLATPHVGGGTLDASRNVFHMSFDNIQSIFSDVSRCHLVNKVQ